MSSLCSPFGRKLSCRGESRRKGEQVSTPLVHDAFSPHFITFSILLCGGNRKEFKTERKRKTQKRRRMRASSHYYYYPTWTFLIFAIPISYCGYEPDDHHSGGGGGGGGSSSGKCPLKYPLTHFKYSFILLPK